ncbi:MAG TPA: thermonuclease family protein [Gammaproteobacteria bacterium]|nr:thermonuclease family protein [Gammaproteobacteria bacterium]
MLLAVVPTTAAAVDCTPLGTLHDAHVRYVIDGDTVILDGGRHIRIVGLNAPEIAHDGEAAQPFAAAARLRLTHWLATAGNHVEWSAAPDRRDRYGRTLAHVYIGGQDAARRLLEAGLAAVIAIPPNVRRSACYRAAEQIARTHHRGLWSTGSGVVRSVAEAAQPGFEIVRGRVASVAEKRAGTLLTLHGGLTVWIAADDRHYFRHPLKRLSGRTILVRGWQYAYHGRPEIIVHHPAALTVVGEPVGAR